MTDQTTPTDAPAATTLTKTAAAPVDLTVCESARGGWTIGFPVPAATSGPLGHATLASLGMQTPDYPGYVIPALTPADIDSAQLGIYIDHIGDDTITFGVLNAPATDTTVRAFLRIA